MTKHSVSVACDLPEGFAVDQVRGMFDLVPAKTAGETFDVELPDLDEDWQIGVIVGPSGSGKTTVARHAYGKQFCEGDFRWGRDKAVVDHFGQLSMKIITATLTAVGFSSPPSWIKPYHVLSGGERFRCDLARALLKPGNLVAFDEFTSVVDRTVAKIGSAAVAKSVRKGRIGKRFVAVTCHYDVLDWLEPDWVLDMASRQLARGCLYRRPKINLDVAPVHRSAWSLFRRHHYLNQQLLTSAKCFAAFWGGEPVAFSAWVHRMTRGSRKHDMRETSVVVLPDFQGVGIGSRLSQLCASIWPGIGGRSFATATHPAVIHNRDRSPNWRTIRYGMVAPTGATGILKRAKKDPGGMAAARIQRSVTGKTAPESCGRITAGFQYVGPAMDRERAELFAAATPLLFKDAAAIDCLAAIRPGELQTARSIVKRTGLPRKIVGATLHKLFATREILSERIGASVAYRLPD